MMNSQNMVGCGRNLCDFSSTLSSKCIYKEHKLPLFSQCAALAHHLMAIN